MVEREMRVTLACRLKDAVGDVKQFKDGNVDPQKFIDWCDKYQVSEERYYSTRPLRILLSTHKCEIELRVRLFFHLLRTRKIVLVHRKP